MQIQKLVANDNMQYQLVLGFARKFHSLDSLPRVSIGFIKEAIKEEDTIQQN
jgi:hypothetical protein